MRNNIKELRAQSQLTQKELAHHAKCSRARLIKIEAGDTPTMTLAFRIAKVFDKGVDEVFIPDWENTT